MSPAMKSAPDISVLIVNWRSGEMTRALVANLRKQKFVSRDGGVGTLEFIVTDNASGPDEEPHLKALEELGCKVIRSSNNSGYALGMNLAAEQAKGDFLLISNPDVMAFRGALAALVEHLRTHQQCGAAGPRGYLDSQRFFQLPPTDLPGLGELVSESLARTFQGAGRCHARARTERAVDVWTATGPVSRSMISGFCMLLPASLARDLGPFDKGFPFYFEDADLCLRLHRKGFSTDYVPRAEMVHFFNRSAGQAQDLAWSRYGVSRRRFFRSRYGWLGRAAFDVLNAFTSSRSGQGHRFAPVTDRGEVREVPTLDVPGSGPYVAEISADPGFVFAAGRLDVSRRFTIPRDVWAGLAPAPYYVRFVHRGGDWEVRGTYKLTKVDGQAPMNAELAAAGATHA